MASAESAFRPMTDRDARPVKRDACQLHARVTRNPRDLIAAQELAEVLAELADHGHPFDPATVEDWRDI